MAHLEINNIVTWRGVWGKDEPKVARVIEIRIWRNNVLESIPKIDWTLVIGREVIVTFDNGHWAYGNQITPK